MIGIGHWLTHSSHNHIIQLQPYVRTSIFEAVNHWCHATFALRSADIFKSFMFGQLGERCIAEYVDILQKFPQLGIEELAPQYFSLSLQAMGEHWRRLCFPTGSFPYVIFKLVEMDDAAFLREYLCLQQLMTDCHNCVDLEFSAVLLSVIPPQSDLESQGVLLQIGRLRRFLYDLCIWAPLSSDIVECYHGFTQCQLHRWRGSKVTDPVAQERTVWYSICSAYGVFKKWMHAQFLDKWFWMRLACFGRKTSNQYTVREDGKRVAKGTCASKPSFTVGKMDRLLALEKDLPRLRKLCGDLSEISAAAHSIVGWLW